LLITQQQTGGGGNEYTVRLIGQGRWEGREQVIRTSTEAGEPQDVLRKELVRVFALMLTPTGLCPFVTA